MRTEQDQTNLTTRYHWYISRAITTPYPELVIQERSQILLFRPCLPHGICVCSSGSLTSLPHVCNLGIALQISDSIDHGPQRQNVAGLEDLRETLSLWRLAVKETGEERLVVWFGDEVGVDF